MECLDSLESAIQSKDTISEEFEEPETPGHFVSNIDRVSDVCVWLLMIMKISYDYFCFQSIHQTFVMKVCQQKQYQ